MFCMLYVPFKQAETIEFDYVNTQLEELKKTNDTPLNPNDTKVQMIFKEGQKKFNSQFQEIGDAMSLLVGFILGLLGAFYRKTTYLDLVIFMSPAAILFLLDGISRPNFWLFILISFAGITIRHKLGQPRKDAI